MKRMTMRSDQVGRRLARKATIICNNAVKEAFGMGHCRESVANSAARSAIAVFQAQQRRMLSTRPLKFGSVPSHLPMPMTTFHGPGKGGTHSHSDVAGNRRSMSSKATATAAAAPKKAADPAKAAEIKARAFVIEVGYSAAVAKGVVKALKDSGMSGTSLLSAVKGMAGRWEVGDDEGLEALAAAVQQTLAAEDGKAVVTFHVVPPNGWVSGEDDVTDGDDATRVDMSKAFQVRGLEGMSVTDIAKFGTGDGANTLGEYIECACAGIMACSTCHVIIDDKWFPKVGKPCEAELDMIDLAYNPKRTSRLACQVKMTKELDGLVLKIPKGSNNLMDFIPFE